MVARQDAVGMVAVKSVPDTETTGAQKLWKRRAGHAYPGPESEGLGLFQPGRLSLSRTCIGESGLEVTLCREGAEGRLPGWRRWR